MIIVVYFQPRVTTGRMTNAFSSSSGSILDKYFASHGFNNNIPLPSKSAPQFYHHNITSPPKPNLNSSLHSFDQHSNTYARAGISTATHSKTKKRKMDPSGKRMTAPKKFLEPLSTTGTGASSAEQLRQELVHSLRNMQSHTELVRSQNSA